MSWIEIAMSVAVACVCLATLAFCVWSWRDTRRILREREAALPRCADCGHPTHRRDDGCPDCLAEWSPGTLDCPPCMWPRPTPPEATP